MTHVYHSSIKDNGLSDLCDRCHFLAKHISGLDDKNLAALIDRVEANLPARSHNEALAMAQVRADNRMAEQLMAVFGLMGAAKRRMAERLLSHEVVQR